METAGLTQTADQLAEMLVSQLGATSVQYALMDGDTILVSGQRACLPMGSDQALSADDQYAIGSVSKNV